MKKFIAYFDYLGFKQLIENNTHSEYKEVIGNNFRDIESALGSGKHIETRNGLIADLSDLKVNCINFSDTIVFWSNDDSEESLNEILRVAHDFNWKAIDYFFPARGALVYGEIEYIDYKHKSETSVYNVNSVFGKGLVKAHEKAEKQNWAGTVFDETIIDELILRGYNLEEFLKPYAKKYKVPYKTKQEPFDEYVMCIITGTLGEEGFTNFGNGIKDNFARYNKSIDSEDVQQKIENTMLFLKTFCD